jgi:hypothetical protein
MQGDHNVYYVSSEVADMYLNKYQTASRPAWQMPCRAITSKGDNTVKKFIVSVFFFALLMTAVNGCSPAPTPADPVNIPFTAQPATAETASDSLIPILVAPFYSSEALEIHVGDYSQQLGTDDLQDLNALAQEMARQKDELTPEQMFVLAIRFYDLGEKDNAVYWFYEAQFRAKLFIKSLDADHFAGLGERSSVLFASYGAFTELAGEYINGYAGCDVDNWVKIVKTVKEDNASPPELDKLFPDSVFVARNQWQGINDQVAAGLGVLIDQLSEAKGAIRQQRATDNQDALFCN